MSVTSVPATQVTKQQFKPLMFFFKLLVPLAFLAFSQPEAAAQAELLSKDTATAAAPVVYAPDSLGRRFPRGTVEGFIKAAAREEYKTAAKYLNLDTKLKK